MVIETDARRFIVDSIKLDSQLQECEKLLKKKTGNT